MPSPYPTPPRANLAQVAALAGCSLATASRALRSPPDAASPKRQRVHAAAITLGYLPDPRATELAHRRWQHARTAPEPIALLVSPSVTSGPLAVIFNAVAARAAELGYRCERFDPGATPREQAALARILRHRGVHALIAPAPAEREPLALDWDRLTAVLIGEDSPDLRFSRVFNDWPTNYALALRESLARGYCRIGFALYHFPGEISHTEQIAQCLVLNQKLGALGHAALPPHFIEPMRPPLSRDIAVDDLRWRRETTRLSTWLRRHSPDVIVTNSSFTYYLLRDLGVHPPQGCGLVVVRCTEFKNFEKITGIDTHPATRGRFAADLLDRLLLDHQRGPMPVPMRLAVAGSWHEGTTVHPRPAPAPLAALPSPVPA